MPRPRFAKLEPERQRSILAVAGEEFAEHGYEGASYNRIIERSGLSKGSMYYYFDDKEDLYATVCRDALQRLVLDVSEMDLATDAASFWSYYRAWYVRSLHLFQSEPSHIGLARSMTKTLMRGQAGGALAELRELSRQWVEGFLAQGQGLGAIRTDLPTDLLFQLVMSLEEGIDLWLGARVGDMTDADIETTADLLTGAYRDLFAPRASPVPSAAPPRKKKKS